MADSPFKVQPGDIITSNLMNFVVEKLDELETRLLNLETQSTPTSQVTINSFEPPFEQNIARTLTLRGRNFSIPPENNTVTIGGVAVTSFGVSTVELLRVVVPVISGVPDNFPIKVTNNNGSDSKLYRILEEVPVTGDPPAVSNITHEDGTAILKLSEGFVITGENFGSSPTVVLRSREANHTDETYNITSMLVTTSNITATLPGDIVLVQEQLFPGGPVRADLMEVEITVGAFNPIITPVQVEA
jgi:hypothetical protein